MHEAISGYSFERRVTVPLYPATSGFTLKYQIIPRTQDSGSAIAITATTDGDVYVISVPPTTTATWEPGEYSFQSWVEKPGFRYPVDSGLLTVLTDPVLLDTLDERTQAEIALADCKAAFANFQSTGGRVKRYVIGSREMEFDSGGDILVLINYWQAQVTRERAAKAVHDGKPDPRRIQIRMSNA